MGTRFDTSGRLAALGLIAGLALGLAACEDSGTLAPSGSTMTITANPSEVTVDPSQGETSAESTIIVQIFDEDGFPADGVSVLMTSSGGSLASSNTCGTGGTCTRTGSACSTSADCQAIDLVTNANGRATDVLTVTENTSSPVTVTATSGMLTMDTEVTIDVVGLNDPPTATVTADDPEPQCAGTNVRFTGTASDPEGDQILCWKWTVAPQNGTVEFTRIGQSNELTYDFDMAMITESVIYTIELDVSDDPAIVGSCSLAGNPDDALFNGIADALDFEIIPDDTTAPTMVDAGADQCKVLSGNSASFALAGSATDPETQSDLDYRWNCGNGQTPAGASVMCTYTSLGDFTATLTVTNPCGEAATDTATLSVVNDLADCP